MRPFLLLILTNSLLLTNAGTLEFAIKSILPSCPSSCLKPVVDLVEEMIDDTITVDRFQALCVEYEEAVECSVEDCADSLSSNDWMEAALSGLKYACVDERNYFEMFLSCVEGYVSAKNITRGCENGCHLRKSLIAYADSPRVNSLIGEHAGSLDFLPHLDGVCSAMSCYVQCFRRDMNVYCGSGGSRLAEVVLRPFEVLAAQFRVTSPDLLSALTNQNTSSCFQFFNPQQLNEIRFDKDFLTKMRILMATRMQQELYSNSDSHPELNELTRLPGPIYKPEPPQWTAYSVTCVVLMAAVVVLNLAVLIFFIVRCTHDAVRERVKRNKYCYATARQDEVRLHVECYQGQENPVEVAVIDMPTLVT